VRGIGALVLLGCGLGSLAGCLSERPRPAPPTLTIAFSKRVVQSPDTLRGRIHAEDPDGIDSVWLAVGSDPPVGQDGLLETVFDAPFLFVIPRGYSPSTRILVTLTGRDVVGFTGELDTVVTVAP